MRVSGFACEAGRYAGNDVIVVMKPDELQHNRRADEDEKADDNRSQGHREAQGQGLVGCGVWRALFFSSRLARPQELSNEESIAGQNKQKGKEGPDSEPDDFVCLDEEMRGEEERRLRVIAGTPYVAGHAMDREFQEEREVNQERYDKYGDVSDGCSSDVNHTCRSEGVTDDQIPLGRNEDNQPCTGEEEEIEEGSSVGQVVGPQNDPRSVGWHSGVVP